MAKDYYDVLGVDKDASQSEIKQAYKRLAKEYHPDLNDDEGSEEKFKEISEAADVLGDEDERRKYDRMGHQAYTEGQKKAQGDQGFGGFGGQRGGAQGFDINDIFDMFMGGGGRGGRRQRQGQDRRADLTLGFEDAALGTTETVTYTRRAPCESCNGRGGHDPSTCPQCNGTGQVEQRQQTALGAIRTQRRCPQCNGHGETFAETCRSCNGSGVQTTQETIDIDVPPGVQDGSRLRVRGKGDASQGRDGDLYVFVTVEDHEFYERDGADILVDIPVSYPQAVFGDAVDVPTIHGDVELTIPSGTDSGTVLRLKDKGIHPERGRKGDQLVTVTITAPDALSGEAQEALEEYAEAIDAEHSEPQQGLFDKIFG